MRVCVIFSVWNQNVIDQFQAASSRFINEVHTVSDETSHSSVPCLFADAVKSISSGAFTKVHAQRSVAYSADDAAAQQKLRVNQPHSSALACPSVHSSTVGTARPAPDKEKGLHKSVAHESLTGTDICSGAQSEGRSPRYRSRTSPLRGKQLRKRMAFLGTFPRSALPENMLAFRKVDLSSSVS